MCDVMCDSLSSLSGPPGPPGGVRADEVTNSSVRVTWSHGTDNLSPISKYIIQYRDIRAGHDWREASTCQYIISHHHYCLSDNLSK